MPHSQKWLKQHQIVYVVFSGVMSSDDIGDAFHDSANHVIESENPPVHFLHNWQQVERFPTSLSRVVKASQNTKAPLRKVGWVVAYGKHGRLFEFMGNIFFQLFNVRFKLVKTRDDALAFLCKQDERLDQSALITAHDALNQSAIASSENEASPLENTGEIDDGSSPD